MTDPLTYLTAALDAAQRDAHDATAGPWSALHPEARWGEYRDAELIGGGKPLARMNSEHNGHLNVDHIARHDPQAVLRRIATDRKILAEHKPTGADYDGNRQCLGCGGYTILPGWGERGYRKSWPCPTVRLLAEGWGWSEETTS